jgi:hypothetical protein
VGVGIACGVPLKAIVAGIEAVDIIPGRCEIIDEGQPFSVVVRRGVGWAAGCSLARTRRLPACSVHWAPAGSPAFDSSPL